MPTSVFVTRYGTRWVRQELRLDPVGVHKLHLVNGVSLMFGRLLTDAGVLSD